MHTAQILIQCISEAMSQQKLIMILGFIPNWITFLFKDHFHPHLPHILTAPDCIKIVFY